MGGQRTRTAPERERRRAPSRPAAVQAEALHESPADHLGALQRPQGAAARTTAALGLQGVAGNLAVQRLIGEGEAPGSVGTATVVTPPAASIAPIMGMAPSMAPAGTLRAAPSSLDTAVTVTPPAASIAPIVHPAAPVEQSIAVGAPAASVAPVVSPPAGADVAVAHAAPAAAPSVVHAPPPLPRAASAPVAAAAAPAPVAAAAAPAPVAAAAAPAPVAAAAAPAPVGAAAAPAPVAAAAAPAPVAAAAAPAPVAAAAAPAPVAAAAAPAPVAAGPAAAAAPAHADEGLSDAATDVMNATLDTTSNIGGVVDANLQTPNDPHQMVDLGQHGAVATSPFGLLNSVQNARQGVNTLGAGGSDIAGGYRSGDWQRGAEGVGRLVEGTAGIGAAGISAVGSVTSMVQAGAVNSGSAMGQAGSTLSNTAQVLGNLGAGASVVTGGIGLLKSGAQGIAAHRRVNRLDEMAQGEQTRATTAGATPAEVAAAQQRQALIMYAAETQRKRRNRAALNATANTAQVVGGALTLSGVGAAAGAGLAMAGSGLKLGASVARGAKQRLRDYYAERDAAGHQRGWFGNLFSRTKTTANKNAEREQRTQQLIAGGAANVELLQQIGGNAEAVALLTNASRTPAETATLTKSISDLFKKRE